jgi:hypothetical protein
MLPAISIFHGYYRSCYSVKQTVTITNTQQYFCVVPKYINLSNYHVTLQLTTKSRKLVEKLTVAQLVNNNNTSKNSQYTFAAFYLSIKKNNLYIQINEITIQYVTDRQTETKNVTLKNLKHYDEYKTTNSLTQSSSKADSS